MKNYIIQCRYETFAKDGKKFINWYNYDTGQYTEKEAKDRIKEIKTQFGYVDQKTKLKHEYRLYDYDEYMKELENLKNKVKKLTEEQEEYYKSDKYKELKKKKAKSAKERKEHQKKYLETHKKEEEVL